MWRGRCEVILNGITFSFEMWHHGGDIMSRQEAIKAMSLKGIYVLGKYYDIYWHAVMSEDEIWIHPNGWFQDKELSDLVGDRANYNFDRETEIDRRKLEVLGFSRII